VQSMRATCRTEFILSVVLLGALSIPVVALDEGGAEAVAVRQLQQEMANAFNAQDIERLMAYHHPDAVYLVPNDPPIAGERAVRTMYAGVFSTYNKLGVTARLEVDTAEVVVSGDWAWARGQARSVITGKDGVRQPTPRWTKHLSIYKKQGGVWLRYRQMRSEN
jgi:uncharacterized protein (TIGR02246 family)